MTRTNNWNQCRLGDVLTKCCGGTWGDASQAPNAAVIRTTNISDDHSLSLKDVAMRLIPERQLERQRLIEGDIVMTKSNSIERVGGCAYFTKPESTGVELEYVTANFCQVLRFNTSLVVPKFAYYWLISPDSQAALKDEATGTSSSLRNINGTKIKAQSFAYPAKPEQERIAALLDQCFTQLDELNGEFQKQTDDLAELKRSLVVGTSGEESEWCEVGTVVDWIQDNESVDRDAEYQFAGIRSFGKGMFVREIKKGDEFAYSTLRRLRTGDFIYPKLMAWEGAFSMVTDEFDGMVVSPEFVVFRPTNRSVSCQTLDTYFRSPMCLEDVVRASTGSNRRRRRLNPRAFLSLQIPLPPLHIQSQLEEVYEFERCTRSAWNSRLAEVSALRSAILRKAFAGEL